MKKGITITRSLEQALEYRRKAISGVSRDRANAMTDEDIERLADEDDKRLGIDPDEWGEPYRVNGMSEIPAEEKRDSDREA